jgi:hypothetical protein
MGPVISLLFVLLFLLLFALPGALLVLGGIASLVIAIDKYDSKKAPIPFAAFFAGFDYWAVLLISGVMFAALLMKESVVAAVLIFVLATSVGGVGGGLYGYRLGLARKRRYAYLYE